MPIARNGYQQYTHISQVWDMKVPIMPDDKVSAGVLGGNMTYTDPDEKSDGSVGDDASATGPAPR